MPRCPKEAQPVAVWAPTTALPDAVFTTPRGCWIHAPGEGGVSLHGGEGCGQTYGGLMAEDSMDAAAPDVMAMFDTQADGGLVCRVCGSMVAAAAEYSRAHWDWHEASNGA